MILENIAERLFCDLRNAEVKIEKPEYIVNGAKIGDVPNSKQFTIFGVKWGNKYSYAFGHIPTYDGIEENVKSFTEAYNEFLEAIKSLGNLKFYSLVVPNKGVMDAKLEEFEKVISRYIEDYQPNNDTLVWRWDVLVKKID